MYRFDQQRLDALHKWARRVVEAEKGKKSVDRRRYPRRPAHCEIALVPLAQPSLEPLTDRRFTVVLKDVSLGGVSLICNEPIHDELFFGEFPESDDVLLLRVVRQRQVRGKILEYGLQILDRFNSYRELRE